jgi:hypothetical protein
VLWGQIPLGFAGDESDKMLLTLESELVAEVTASIIGVSCVTAKEHETNITYDQGVS